MNSSISPSHFNFSIGETTWQPAFSPLSVQKKTKWYENRVCVNGFNLFSVATENEPNRMESHNLCETGLIGGPVLIGGLDFQNCLRSSIDNPMAFVLMIKNQ